MTNFRQYTNTTFDFFRNILDMVFPSKIAVNIDPKIPDALYLMKVALDTFTIKLALQETI